MPSRKSCCSQYVTDPQLVDYFYPAGAKRYGCKKCAYCNAMWEWIYNPKYNAVFDERQKCIEYLLQPQYFQCLKDKHKEMIVSLKDKKWISPGQHQTIKSLYDKMIALPEMIQEVIPPENKKLEIPKIKIVLKAN